MIVVAVLISSWFLALQEMTEKIQSMWLQLRSWYKCGDSKNLYVVAAIAIMDWNLKQWLDVKNIILLSLMDWLVQRMGEKEF